MARALQFLKCSGVALMSKWNILHRLQPAFDPVIKRFTTSRSGLGAVATRELGGFGVNAVAELQKQKMHSRLPRFLQFYHFSDRKWVVSIVKREEEVWIAISNLSM